MKKLLFIFAFITSVFYSNAQTNSLPKETLVRKEVRKLVSLLESNKAALVPYGSDKAVHKSTDSCSLYLVYRKNGKKDLYLDNYMDAGANGWGEPRDKTTDYDGISADDYDRTYLGYNKELQAMYLDKYLKKIQYWQKILAKK